MTVNLKRALVGLKSHLIQVKTVTRTEFREQAPVPLRENMRIGVMPIGLRDGMASLSCGEVLVRGERVSVLGGFSLEHTRIDLTDVPGAEVGDEVAIFGRQGAAEITPENRLILGVPKTPA